MSSFLYPSLRSAEPGRIDDDSAVAGLIATVRDTWLDADIADQRSIDANREQLDRACQIVLERVGRGGRVLVLGNGGSACDADRLVRLVAEWLPARSLLDTALLSALANDVGATRMFARQVETFATERDVIVAFSTSGASPNVVEALASAKRVGASTVAFVGYDGAGLPDSAELDVCLRVASSSVHRIQETQGALCDALVARLRAATTVKEAS